MSIVQNKIFVISFLLLPLIFSISNSLADIIISIIAIYGVYKFVTEKKEYRELFFFIFLTILYLSVIALFSENKFNSFHSSFLLVRFPFFLFGILVLNQIQNVQIKKISLYLYLTIMIISIVIIIEWLFIDSYRPAGPFNWSLKGNLSEHKEFIAGNFISKFMLIALSATWTINFFKNVNIIKFLVNLSLLIIMLSIFLTQERTAFIFACILIFLAAFFKFNKFINYKFLFSSIIILILATVLFSSGYIKDRMINNFFDQVKIENGEFNYFSTARGKNHIYGIDVWRSSPLLGVGVENFYSKCKELNLDTNDISCSNYTFNIYTDLLAETGIIGLILFIMFFYSIIKINISYMKLKTDNYLQIASFLTYLLIIFPLLPSYSFFSQNFMILFWLIISINLLAIKNEK